LDYFQANDFKLFKRSQVLGLISSAYKTLAVAGTHGKTTTSCLLAHVLNDSAVAINAFLGGISRDFDSNLVLNDEARYFVTEADEYDRSFLQLSPDIAIITSLDADHLDIYGTPDEMVKNYQDFVRKIKPGGTLITKLAFVPVLSFRDDIQVITYGLEGDEDYSAHQIEVKDSKYHFDVITPEGSYTDLSLGLPGRHNVDNAVSVIAIAHLLGVKEESLKTSLNSFKGVQRRFDVQYNKDNKVYVDDYAHHPSEINACVQSVRELFPNKKLTAVFQPHLYSRTRDFEAEFAESLSQVDELILLDIYPARELPIEGVTSENLLKNITIENKEVCSKEQLMDVLKKKEIEVLLTIGAGDIDRFVQPIKSWISNE
jgi:UDP-N-acetylmuramate--alanine ligase